MHPINFYLDFFLGKKIIAHNSVKSKADKAKFSGFGLSYREVANVAVFSRMNKMQKKTAKKNQLVKVDYVNLGINKSLIFEWIGSKDTQSEVKHIKRFYSGNPILFFCEDRFVSKNLYLHPELVESFKKKVNT
ncbi:hypothetical protein [Moorena sp. SIO2C4]|uniref:hypothetical protein n=1 Tax=Moorena sp. SIO2C4 TaxID=2607824 RepID=UPI0013CA6D6B|nr:hypothetical protein [Moorena sp. SIO2C4]NES40530.1 hypothetical protein [Moorena sp. SIO2C4]